MVNVYDFDKTIYFGNSSFHFCIYCLKKRPWLIILAPLQIINLILYGLNLTNNKSVLFCFLRFVDGEKLVTDFWDCHESRICSWYLNQKSNEDLIVSASPQFLIQEIANRLGVKCIASNVDIRTGRCVGDCKGKDKVIDFCKQYPNTKIVKAYGDSKSDRFIMQLAHEAYFVKNQNKQIVQMIQMN